MQLVENNFYFCLNKYRKYLSSSVLFVGYKIDFLLIMKKKLLVFHTVKGKTQKTKSDQVSSTNMGSNEN